MNLRKFFRDRQTQNVLFAGDGVWGEESKGVIDRSTPSLAQIRTVNKLNFALSHFCTTTLAEQ